MDEHAHHWQMETPTGGRMRCNCGAFYLNGKIIASQDDPNCSSHKKESR